VLAANHPLRSGGATIALMGRFLVQRSGNRVSAPELRAWPFDLILANILAIRCGKCTQMARHLDIGLVILSGCCAPAQSVVADIGARIFHKRHLQVEGEQPVNAAS